MRTTSSFQLTDLLRSGEGDRAARRRACDRRGDLDPSTRELSAGDRVLLLFVAYRVLFFKVGYFEWYGVPAVAALVLLAAIGLDRCVRWILQRSTDDSSPAEVAILPALLLALVYAWPLPYRTEVEDRSSTTSRTRCGIRWAGTSARS